VNFIEENKDLVEVGLKGIDDVKRHEVEQKSDAVIGVIHHCFLQIIILELNKLV